MIELGIIGCGGIGKHHARIFSEMKNVRIVSVCDVIESKAVELARKVGCAPCTDYRPLLDQADAVLICTEPFHRIEIVTAAAEAGKHIFCEKPIALGLGEADEIIRIIDRSGVKFMLGYVLRFTHPFKLLRETFASGELGELVNCWTRRYMPMDPRKSWHNRQESSGGVALDFGSHDVDWLMWIGGPVKTVFAAAARIRPAVQSDEHSQGMFTFARGGMGAMDVTWWDAVGESSIGIIGTRGSMSVDRSGTVRKKIPGERETVLDVETSMSVDPEGSIGKAGADGTIDPAAQKTETIQEHFIRCIEQDTRPAVTARDGRAVLKTVLAINESARTGKAVDLNDD